MTGSENANEDMEEDLEDEAEDEPTGTAVAERRMSGQVPLCASFCAALSPLLGGTVGNLLPHCRAGSRTEWGGAGLFCPDTRGHAVQCAKLWGPELVTAACEGMYSTGLPEANPHTGRPLPQ